MGSDTPISENQEVARKSGVGGKLEATPQVSSTETTLGWRGANKRVREDGWMASVSYAEKVTVDKMAIDRQEHPDSKLTEEEAAKVM